MPARGVGTLFLLGSGISKRDSWVVMSRNGGGRYPGGSYTSHQKCERRIRGWKQGKGKGNEVRGVGENEPQDVGDLHSEQRSRMRERKKNQDETGISSLRKEQYRDSWRVSV